MKEHVFPDYKYSIRFVAVLVESSLLFLFLPLGQSVLEFPYELTVKLIIVSPPSDRINAKDKQPMCED